MNPILSQYESQRFTCSSSIIGPFLIAGLSDWATEVENSAMSLEARLLLPAKARKNGSNLSAGCVRFIQNTKPASRVKI